MARDILIKFVGDSTSLARSTKDVISGLSDTESGAKAVGDRFRDLARNMDTQAGEMRETVSRLADALGTETVAKIEALGGSVDQVVIDLQRGGVQLQDIKANADDLALGLREVVDAGSRLKELDDNARQGAAGLEQLDDKARTAADSVERVHSSSDQSRSVLANMVGNSAQDVAELGGVAGTAGVALGQLGEYAADGNIQLSGMAKIVGPMALLTAGTVALTWAVKAAGSEAREAKRETELWVKVNDELSQQKYRDAAEALADEWRDTIPILRELGYGEADLIRTLQGENDVLDELKRRREDAREASDGPAARHSSHEEVMRNEALVETLDKVIENLEEGRTARGAAIETTEQHTATVDALTLALGGETEATAAAKRAAEEAEPALRTFSDAAWSAELATRQAEEATNRYNTALETLRGNLDQRAAARAFEEAMLTYRAEVEHSEASTDDYIGKLATVITQLGNIPEETKTQMLINLDQGMIDAIESRISFLVRDRNIVINGQIVGADFNNAREDRGAGHAQGGPTAGGQRVPIAENGPETYMDASGVTWLVARGPGNVTPLVAKPNTGSAATLSAPPTVQVVLAPKGSIYGEKHLRALVQDAVRYAVLQTNGGGRFPT